VLERQIATQEPLSGDELLGSVTVEGAGAMSGAGWEACVRDLAARAGIRRGAPASPLPN
jgi:hypothetical protein